ncbi:MAG: 2-oxoacid:acceptor oxidoreductase family protein [Candidatus Omnitrophica bacterium]|nr:2-oxoacid:acceptor oxidoreductase family protein [Candidatus Omnitrophota bacterium]
MSGKGILEIRWHGRGGQGAKTAAQLLAETAMDEGKYIQAFPEYGPERAGAPIKAFTRISDEPINLHCGVSNPQIVVVIDPTLLDAVDVAEGIPEDGILLVNSDQSPQVLRQKLNFRKGKVYTLDATKVALETVGLPLPNTPMLGALLKAADLVSLNKIEDKLTEKFLKKIGEKKTKGNIESVRRAYNEVQAG